MVEMKKLRKEGNADGSESMAEVRERKVVVKVRGWKKGRKEGIKSRYKKKKELRKING